jgi:Ca2+-transporting ATPase
MLVAAAKAGMDKEELEKHFPRLDDLPFQSEKKYMATLHRRYDGGRLVFVKGAVEKLLAQSKHIVSKGKVVPLTEAQTRDILKTNLAMSRDALRVVATAYTEFPREIETLKGEDIQGRLIFVGLSGIIDPPREDAKRAIKLCKGAGIRVLMITGDHKTTAEAIARQLDLPLGRTITGDELQAMSDEELSQQIGDTSIFARIEPFQKLRIVNALKSRGDIVAMTGDGVNDAPALKVADIGIAMGITGTDVAKEASDMVLADDNFASVVSAVEEGRAIFNRLRNVTYMLLSTNLGQLLALILSVLFIGKAPLLAVQILWINFASDTTTAIPVGLEAKSGDELKQPPRHPGVGLLFPGMLQRIAFQSIMMGVGIFLVFNWAQARVGLEEARTIAFCSMAIFAWFKALNARSDEHTVMKLGIFSNRWLVISISTAIMLQIAVVYAPPFQAAFGTIPLHIEDWGISILAGAGLFGIEETRKALCPKLFSLGKWQPSKRSTFLATKKKWRNL